MNTKDTMQKVTRLIGARSPIIAIASHEEGRVVEAVKQIARSQGKTLITWTISEGLRQVEPDDADASEELEGLEDPVAALQHVMAYGSPTEELPFGKPAIFLFKDLHPFLTGDRADVVVIRALRDLAGELIRRHQTVILLSPQAAIPNDLEKDVQAVDFPLPSQGELAEQVDCFIENLPARIPCNVNGDRQDLVRALQGLTAVEADSVLSQAVIALGHLDVDALPFILEAKAEIIRQSGAMEYYPEQVGYEQIGGLDLLKLWCREAEFGFTPEAEEFGVEPDRGILIVGVPGCGKSLTAKAVAGGKRPLLRLDIGALFGSLVGQSEQQTRQALKVAEAVAPCVLWIDEIEKALGSGGGELDGGTSQRVFGTLLTWMEETDAPVFIVATANNISTLRPELIRRFSETFFVDLPQPEERFEILRIHLLKRNRQLHELDLDAVVRATAQFTGSELEKLVQSAIKAAFVDGKRTVTTDDLLNAAASVVPLAATMKEGIEQMRAWASRARPASSKQEPGVQNQAKGRALGI